MTEPVAQTNVSQNPIGITCPACGSETIEVIRTVRITRALHRERACIACGNPFTTCETYSADAAERVTKQLIRQIFATNPSLFRPS